MKRKKRNSDKSQIDMSKPITNVLAFGSADDPCFGKHYSIDANECKRCGDCELCQIAQANQAHIKRAKMAEKEAFKDLEEVDIEVNLALKNIVITNKVTDYIDVCKLVKKKFGMAELLEAKKAVRKAVDSQKQFKIIKKDDKRYVKPVKA